MKSWNVLIVNQLLVFALFSVQINDQNSDSDTSNNNK